MFWGSKQRSMGIQAKILWDPSKGLYGVWGSKQRPLVIQTKVKRDPSKGLWRSKLMSLGIQTKEIHIVCGFAEVNKTNGLE
jgi:hypothetical protein